MVSAGPYASLYLVPADNHASTPPLCFLQAGCPSCRPTNSVKALKAVVCLQCFDYEDNTTIKEHNTKKIHSKLNTPQTEIPRIHNISKLYTCMSISLQTLSASFKRLKARQRKQKWRLTRGNKHYEHRIWQKITWKMLIKNLTVTNLPTHSSRNLITKYYIFEHRIWQ